MFRIHKCFLGATGDVLSKYGKPCNASILFMRENYTSKKPTFTDWCVSAWLIRGFSLKDVKGLKCYRRGGSEVRMTQVESFSGKIFIGKCVRDINISESQNVRSQNTKGENI